MTDLPTPEEEPLDPVESTETDAVLSDTTAIAARSEELTDNATQLEPEPEAQAENTMDEEAIDQFTENELLDAENPLDATDHEDEEAVDQFTENELLDAANPLDATDHETAASESADSAYEPATAAFGSPDSGGTVPPVPPSPPTEPPAGAYPPPHAAPPGYAPPPVRRLYRSRHDRKLGGVSAGIAEHFGVDPTIVRLATLAFAISGVGIFVYLAAWAVVPMRPDGWVEGPRTTPVANERTMTLAFGVAALALAFGIITDSWTVLALALIGGGIWLLSEQTALAPAAAAAPAPSASPSFEPMAYAPAPPPSRPQAQPQSWSAATAPPPAAPPSPPYVAPPPKQRMPQRITWTVLSLLTLLAAVGVAAASGDWFDVSAVRFVGIGIVIIGTGVVVGQLRGGGARGLIPLGLLAALALFPVSAIDGLLDEGIGETVYRPQTIEELESSYKFGIGDMVVDLSEIDFSGRTDAIDIDLGIGDLTVIVSEETGGRAVLEAKAGELAHELANTGAFQYDDGLNIDSGTVRLRGDNGSVDLSINVGFGVAELRTEDN